MGTLSLGYENARLPKAPALCVTVQCTPHPQGVPAPDETEAGEPSATWSVARTPTVESLAKAAAAAQLTRVRHGELQNTAASSCSKKT